MHRTASTLTFGLLLALAGCPGDPDPPVGTDTTGTADSGTTTNGTTPGSSSNASADSTTDPGTTTDDPPGTTTDDPPDTTTTDPGTTTMDTMGSDSSGNMSECEPPGDACGDCVAMSCCDELMDCQMDADCMCFQECAAENPGMDGAIACAGKCGIGLPDLLNPATVVGALASCTQENCPKCL